MCHCQAAAAAAVGTNYVEPEYNNYFRSGQRGNKLKWASGALPGRPQPAAATKPARKKEQPSDTTGRSSINNKLITRTVLIYFSSNNVVTGVDDFSGPEQESEQVQPNKLFYIRSFAEIRVYCTLNNPPTPPTSFLETSCH